MLVINHTSLYFLSFLKSNHLSFHHSNNSTKDGLKTHLRLVGFTGKHTHWKTQGTQTTHGSSPTSLRASLHNNPHQTLLSVVLAGLNQFHMNGIWLLSIEEIS